MYLEKWQKDRFKNDKHGYQVSDTDSLMNTMALLCSIEKYTLLMDKYCRNRYSLLQILYGSGNEGGGGGETGGYRMVSSLGGEVSVEKRSVNLTT